MPGMVVGGGGICRVSRLRGMSSSFRGVGGAEESLRAGEACLLVRRSCWCWVLNIAEGIFCIDREQKGRRDAKSVGGLLDTIR